MSEWWTYTLSDFLLFSPRTYYRTDRALQPRDLAGAARGRRDRRRDRRAAGGRTAARRDRIVAACSPPAGCGSHGRFTTSATRRSTGRRRGSRRRSRSRRCCSSSSASSPGASCSPGAGKRFWFAIALIAIIVVGYPLLAPLTGRAWTTAETFGVAADPTAIATVAVLALVRGRIRWLLLVVPLLWCAFAALTLWAMNSPEAVVVAAAALLALLLAARGTWR